MSDYSKTVDFAAKDALPTGYPGKVALGTQVDTEFNNIQIAVATKADVPAAPIVNEIPVTTAGGDLTNSGLFATGGEILDANGNELLEFGTTASAVATLKVTNAATGNPLILSVSSSVAGADIGMTLSDTNSNELLKLSSVDSAVNEVTITNAATGNDPSVTATGGDTNIDLVLSGKGSGTVTITTLNGVATRSIVILDTPEVLGTATTTGSWVTINSATLASALAKSAIIKIIASAASTATIQSINIYIRKTGSALTNDAITRIGSSTNTATNASDQCVGYSLVNLDSNYDFDYRVDIAASTLTCSVVLVGYYV